MSATVNTTEKSAMKLRHATTETAPFVPGRRTFFTYRDLGVTDATHGAMRALVMAAITGMTEPTGWHYHVCEGQFVYALKGGSDIQVMLAGHSGFCAFNHNVAKEARIWLKTEKARIWLKNHARVDPSVSTV